VSWRATIRGVEFEQFYSVMVEQVLEVVLHKPFEVELARDDVEPIDYLYGLFLMAQIS